MKMDVYCTVNNCHYWGSGNQCQASQIIITSDSFVNQAADSVDAPQATNLAATPVSNCVETACKTFVAKNAPAGTRQADRVTRQR